MCGTYLRTVQSMASTYTDLDSALDALKTIYVDADGFPAVTDQQLTAVLAECQETDTDGLNPSDDGYVVTIEMAVAASRAWSLKAMLCATAYDITTDSQGFQRSQATKACHDMARYWRNRVVY